MNTFNVRGNIKVTTLCAGNEIGAGFLTNHGGPLAMSHVVPQLVSQGQPIFGSNPELFNAFATNSAGPSRRNRLQEIVKKPQYQ